MDLNLAQTVIEKINYLFFNSFLEVVGFVIKVFDFIGFTFLNIGESLPENEKQLVCIMLLIFILILLLNTFISGNNTVLLVKIEKK